MSTYNALSQPRQLLPLTYGRGRMKEVNRKMKEEEGTREEREERKGKEEGEKYGI